MPDATTQVCSTKKRYTHSPYDAQMIQQQQQQPSQQELERLQQNNCGSEVAPSAASATSPPNQQKVVTGVLFDASAASILNNKSGNKARRPSSSGNSTSSGEGCYAETAPQQMAISPASSNSSVPQQQHLQSSLSGFPQQQPMAASVAGTNLLANFQKTLNHSRASTASSDHLPSHRPGGGRRSTASSSSNSNNNNSAPGSNAAGFRPGGKPTVMLATKDDLNAAIGSMPSLARTSQGSSFLQAVLRSDPQNTFDPVFSELYPCFAQLLEDEHGCYVVRALLELLPAPHAATVLSQLSSNEALWLRLCTKSLHSRRIVQFITEQFPSHWRFLLPIVHRHFHTIALTTQGCITVQRIIDACSAVERENLFHLVRASLPVFMEDQCGSYVVQYLLQHGDAASNMAAFQTHCSGRFLMYSCNKYVSSIFEKAVQILGSPFHALLLLECGQLNDIEFCAVLNDGYGNYVVQTLINNGSLEVLAVLADRIKGLQSHIVFATKLQQRINQRAIHLKRKAH